MENQNYLGKNLTKLPPGLRFHPTDEEVLFEYLRCKVLNFPLPASVIPDVEFLEFDPWDLPGNNEEMRYFFIKKEVIKPCRKRKKTLKLTRSGYWKASGSTKAISPPQTQNLGMNMVRGLKKSFVFYQGNPPKGGRRTDWVMHEYSLDFNSCEVDYKVMEEWIICKVFMKQRNEEVYDSSSSLCGDDECSDNFDYSSTTNNSSTYYCRSPTSSSTSVYKATTPFHSNYYYG